MKLDELKRLLTQADPAVVLVPARVLRSIIQREEKAPHLLIEVPHQKCHVFSRQVVFREIEQDKLELEPDRRLPESVILIARPSPEELEGDRDALLLRYWRFLFHSKVDQSLMTQAADGQFTADHLRSRIDAIGQTEFEEIRSVLLQENFLAHPEDDLRVYIEFAALYLDLRYFASNLRTSYFPSLRNFAAIDALLAQDVEAETLFRNTRLDGAPDPVIRTDTSSDESNDYFHRLLALADDFSARGDTIRAAIIRTKAARVAPAALTVKTRRAAHADLERLTERLKAALNLDGAAAEEWLQALPGLLDKADQGQWTNEARLLYDLQNVCVEAEKKTFALDVVEWLASAGHRPIQRPLHSLQVVRMTKHLRSAAQRLTMARISDEDRQKLNRLLRTAEQESERRLRERFRPLLSDAIQDVGLIPKSNPEKAARRKLVEEILDRITAHGYFTFADLRDTLARNQLKMEDLADPYDFWRGDALLRLDRRLATAMDGVYRRGEFYLRTLERISSLLFGAETGRFLTLNLLIPFGAAFLVLGFIKLIVLHYAESWFGFATPLDLFVNTLWLGLVFLAYLHSAALRETTYFAGRAAGRGLRFLLYEGPRRFFRLPAVQRFFRSWTYLLVSWYLLKPLAFSTLIWLVWPETFARREWALLVFVGSLAALNSKSGVMVSEAFKELLFLVYSWVRFDFFQGLIRWTLWLFRRISDAFEQALYTVDEWLRFTTGASWWEQGIRAVLGILWFPVGYLLRFYFTTMIEPTINPLKLPLSSLAAKFLYLNPVYLSLLYPVTEDQRAVVERAIAGMEGVMGRPLALALFYVLLWPTLWLLPSFFAFFIWELRGNWRTFRANRPKTLRQAMVSQQQGETLPMLLRPGFHSGTVPKLFASLRQAERQAYRTGQWRPARAYRQTLQEVAFSVQVFVEREFIALLKELPTWKEAALEVGAIELSGNRIAVSVRHGDLPEAPLRFGFDERSGWLLAGILANGWLDHSDPARREQVVLALAGLYKLAGADLIREQIRALLAPREPGYDVTEDGLTLWPVARGGERIVYNLNSLRDGLRPRASGGTEADGWPELPAERVRFVERPFAWSAWVACWDAPEGVASPQQNDLLGGWTFYLPPPEHEPPGQAPRAQASADRAASNHGASNGSANGRSRLGAALEAKKPAHDRDRSPL